MSPDGEAPGLSDGAGVETGSAARAASAPAVNASAPTTITTAMPIAPRVVFIVADLPAVWCL
ncbi:MAG: hypothetical protein J0I66_01620 [Microbacterium sp.]|nr:hypothetical protein [Microbacterium sp.]